MTTIEECMKFIPLHYRELVTVINCAGDVGVVTLWSPIDRVLSRFLEWNIDLDPTSSRIAVIANLYGKGLPQMLRNMLYNPQIERLLVLGQNLSGSREDLKAFFEHGIEPHVFLSQETWRIKTRNFIMDGKIDKDSWPTPVTVTALGKLSDADTRSQVRSFFGTLLPQTNEIRPRQEVALTETTAKQFPTASTTIIRNTPLEAWLELLFRISRFGITKNIAKGSRRELQNTHVIISDPRPESPLVLKKYGFDYDQESLAEDNLFTYSQKLFDGSEPETHDAFYTYGHRIRTHFGKDMLLRIITLLQADLESRHCLISLWDSSIDLFTDNSVPCLDSLYFRVFDDKLTLTATFRTHNAQEGWLRNVYALIAILHHVAAKINVPIGALTVFSRIASIHPDNMQNVSLLIGDRKSDDNVDHSTGKRFLRLDPNGYFSFTVDKENGQIVAEHCYEGVMLSEYRGKSAKEIFVQLERDCAVSLPSHAFYVGQQLTILEQKLLEL